jgi:uncharacterized membrane protein HdeD (DUF308 family)
VPVPLHLTGLLVDDGLVRTWWAYGLRGAVAISFGVLALMWPGLTLVGLAALFAAFALIGGVVSMAAAIRHRQAGGDWGLVFLIGVVSIGAGIVAIDHPTFTMVALVLLMGVNAIVTGALDIAFAVRLRRVIEGECLLVAAGVLSIIFGVLLVLFPSAGALALVWLIAFYAILTGMLLLALAARAWGRAKKIDAGRHMDGGEAGRHGLQT